jgi:hypothetical protein
VLPILKEELGPGNPLGRSLQGMSCILHFGAGLTREHLDFVHTDERVTKIVL